MPAILPSGPCAQVNPLFQAAPSASSLAAWHASKTLCTSSVTKHFSPLFFFIPDSGDFQHSGCSDGEKSVRTCRSPPTLPFVFLFLNRAQELLSPLLRPRTMKKPHITHYRCEILSHEMKIKHGQGERSLAPCSGKHQTTVSSSPE